MLSVGKAVVFKQVCCNILQKFGSFSAKILRIIFFGQNSFSAILRAVFKSGGGEEALALPHQICVGKWPPVPRVYDKEGKMGKK